MAAEIKKHVNITQSLANGEIGFFNSPVYVDIDEPNVTNTKVSLTIMRDGASMDVLIYWRVKSDNKLFTRDDVNATHGFVMLRKGNISCAGFIICKVSLKLGDNKKHMSIMITIYLHYLKLYKH